MTGVAAPDQVAVAWMGYFSDAAGPIIDSQVPLLRLFTENVFGSGVYLTNVTPSPKAW